MYIVSVLIAFLFHQTSLIAVPLYFVFDRDRELSKKSKKLLVIGYILVIVFINTVLSFIGSDWKDYIVSTGTSNMSFYLNLAWAIIFLINYDSLVEYDKRNELFILAYILGTLFSVIGFWSVYGKRIGLYFTSCQFVLMSELPFCKNDIKNPALIKMAVLAYSIALFVFSYYIKGQADIIPFSFYVG